MCLEWRSFVLVLLSCLGEKNTSEKCKKKTIQSFASINHRIINRMEKKGAGKFVQSQRRQNSKADIHQYHNLIQFANAEKKSQ